MCVGHAACHTVPAVAMGSGFAASRRPEMTVVGCINCQREDLRRLGGLHAGADGTAHAGAAEAAVAHGVLRQVLLVVVLGKIEWWCVDDLGGDGVVAAPVQSLRANRL